MTELELQDWLLETCLSVDLEHMSVASCLLELDNVTPDPTTEKLDFDWPRSLFAASILARSEKRSHREASLRVATAAILLSTDPSIRDAAAIVLEKLTNHRSVALAEHRDRIAPKLNERLGVTQRIEREARKLNSSILLQSTGQRINVNQFQLDFWSAATKDQAWLSASAPTASGKTFLILKWIVDSLGAGQINKAIYLAPTRALLSEIENELSRLIKQTELMAEVTTLPSGNKYNEATKEGKKCVLVLTQERLHLLANAVGEDLQVDLLVVDEAHKIGDTQRGVILQDAIERLLRSSPKTRVVFVSPATQNPEILLDDAPNGTRKVPIDSDVVTVLQNVITAHQAPAKPTKWKLDLRQGEKYSPLGLLSLENKPNTVKKRLAFIAAAVGARGGTLVYTNGAADAEAVALIISQLTPTPDNPDPDLSALADLAKRGVHANYQLAPLVQQGVAFHYGNMPSLIRLEIERLFRNGKIKFLVCTSTLIEGVNLSCRTIVVRGPQRGKGTPMSPQDFWNLAGRAGRWGNEFQGNIVCIDASKAHVWPFGVPQRTRYPIQRETDSVLMKIDGLISYIDQRMTGALPTAGDARQFEQVSSYLAATYVRDGSLAAAPLSKRLTSDNLERIEACLKNAVAGIDIAPSIGTRNPGVSLFGLQKLLSSFRNCVGPIEDLLLTAPESDDAYAHFTRAMARINDCVLPVFSPPTRIPLLALVVLEWLRGLSLPTIIRKRIDYQQKHKIPLDYSKTIRDTLELIETTARFLAPRYFSAYVDVLNQFLRERGREDLIDDDFDIGLALEFGVTSTTLRSLMELGMSRISAVALYELIARDDLDQKGCVQWVSDRIGQLESLGLPKIVIREILERIRPKVASEEN